MFGIVVFYLDNYNQVAPTSLAVLYENIMLIWTSSNAKLFYVQTRPDAS